MNKSKDTMTKVPSLNFLDYTNKFLFPFYFDFYNKKIFRYALYNYDFFFTPKISKSYIFLDIGLKMAIKIPFFFFYNLYPYGLKTTRLFFWREFKFLVYNSFNSDVSFEKKFDINLKFFGYFPFNYYNFLSYSNLGILCKLDAVFYDISSFSNYGFRRLNHNFTDVDLQVSTLLFNNFKRFNGVSFFRFFLAEILMVNGLPNASVFVSFYDNLKKELVKKYFFTLYLRNFFFKLRNFFLFNLFTFIKFEQVFYLTIVKSLFFRFNKFFLDFINSLFIYKKLNLFFNFYFFFKVFSFFFTNLYFFKFIFFEFFFLKKFKRFNYKVVKKFLFKFIYLFIFKFNLSFFFLKKKSKVFGLTLRNKEFSNVKYINFFASRVFKEDTRLKNKLNFRINFMLSNPFNSYFFKEFV
jgi:hypothetical protein